MVVDDCLVLLEVAMMEMMSSRTSTGFSSMAMMMLLRNWERQHGIRAAGVEGVHDRRRRRFESGSIAMTRPSVG